MPGSRSLTSVGAPVFSPTATLSPTPTATNTPVIARSGLAFFPTGYSNGIYRSDGFNLDLLFAYFIGSIVEKQRGQQTETLNPLRLWLFTFDAKYGWMEEWGNRPAIATGLMDTMLLEGSNPTSGGSSGGTLKFTSTALGGIYTTVSKRVSKRTALHLGYMRGNLGGLVGGGKLRRVFPTGNFSDLMLKFAQGLEPYRNESAPNILYTGLDFRWLGTTWRFEVAKPFPLSKHPYLIDTKIDRLFAFNLAYEHWQGGYAVLGYFNFRFTIFPTTPKKAPPLQ